MSTPLPPPPPPVPRAQPAGHHEPYGAVQMTQRRTAATESSTASYYHTEAASTYSTPYMAHAAAPMYYAAAAPSPVPVPSLASPIPVAYAYNRISLVFLLPPLLAILYTGRPEEESETSLLLPVLLSTILALYSFDLANLRNVSLSGAWLALVILAAINAIDTFRKGDDTGILFWGFQVVAATILFACWACWYTLQFQWLARDSPRFAQRMEQLFHAILPLCSAAVLTNSVTMQTSHHWGIDRAATLEPYLFAFLLAAGMWFLGAATLGSGGDEKANFILSTSQAWWHSTLLVMVPPLMHITSFRRRIVSSYASMDEWSDLVLVFSVPYLLNYGMNLNKSNSPYGKGPFMNTTLRGTTIPIFLSIIASLFLQKTYLIPWCQSVAYQFHGHDLPPKWVFSVYLTLATLSILFCVWVMNRKSAQTGEPLFGEYREDVIQTSLALTGLCVGKAVGMPWNLTPLPILAFLGLSIWITSRMLRYLSIFLFVAHSTGVVLFSYRFAGISFKIALSIPGVQVGLIRFSMIIVSSSVLIGLVMGLSVRSPGGVGSAILKEVDVTGMLIVIYGLLLTTLECTLMKEPVPFRSLTGAEVTEWDAEDAMVYDPWTALLTSVVLGGITVLLQKKKLITSQAAVVSFSVAIGKAVAAYIDMNIVVESYGGDSRGNSKFLLLRSLVAAMLFVIMLAPRVFLRPVHVKTTTGAGRYKRALGPSSKPVSDIPKNANRIIFGYALIVVPLTLVASIPTVLEPFAVALSGHYGGAYYVSPPGPAEILGFAMSLWGLSCLSMVNHYLPDGGGETWKKLSALTFLMGVGVALSAPTVPDWIGGARASASAAGNPYATISSVGARLTTNDRSRSGGWGLISASLATLLAVTGPLELQERRDAPGRKDTLVLFRLMVFSLMFGCGVAWFVTMQSMSEEEFLTVFVTATACMAMAFFGTVSAVLGYFLELQNFDEASQVAKVWIGAFPIFGLIAGVSQFATEGSHPFGMGGWLSTYLALCGGVALAFALVLRYRSTKNSSTRGFGNLSCIASWACSVAVLYGHYGVSGLDGGLDRTSVVGIPISVFGTFLTSLIFLALEGEVAVPRRSKVQFMSGGSSKPKSSFGFNLQNLGPSNRFAPPAAACVVVLLCATIYAIFFRGCGWLAVPTNHEQVFANLYGDKRTTGGDDLASIVKTNIVHDHIITTSAKLAGSGFWTAEGMFGPLLHVVGLVATLPSLFFLVTQLWTGERSSKAAICAPLNLLPVVICKGIPALRALALIGLVGGVLQIVTRRQHDQQSRMQI